MIQASANYKPRRSSWRLIGWSTAALILLAPAMAMLVTEEVQWGPGDFAVFAVMLALLGGAIELAVRFSRNRVARTAMIGGAVLLFLLVWAELAVDAVSQLIN